MKLEHSSLCFAISDRRRAKIVSAIDVALAKNALSPTLAGSLAGQATFACTAVFGKVGRAAIKPLYQRQHNLEGSDALSSRLRCALESSSVTVVSAKPKRIHTGGSGRRPVHLLYTDAAGNGAIAAVLFLADRNRPYVCSCTIPMHWMRKLKARKNQIGIFEAIAVLMAIESLDHLVKESDLFIFVDNTQAQALLANGFGDDEDVCVVAAAFWERAAGGDVGVWFERVDSKSNWADGPTRPEEPQKSADLMALRPIRVTARLPVLSLFHEC